MARGREVLFERGRMLMSRSACMRLVLTHSSVPLPNAFERPSSHAFPPPPSHAFHPLGSWRQHLLHFGRHGNFGAHLRAGIHARDPAAVPTGYQGLFPSQQQPVSGALDLTRVRLRPCARARPPRPVSTEANAKPAVGVSVPPLRRSRVGVPAGSVGVRVLLRARGHDAPGLRPGTHGRARGAHAVKTCVPVPRGRRG